MHETLAHNAAQAEGFDELHDAPLFGLVADMDVASYPDDVLDWLEDTSNARTVTRTVRRVRALGLDVVSVELTPWIRCRKRKGVSERRWTLDVVRAVDGMPEGVGELLITERRAKTNGKIRRYAVGFSYTTAELVVALGLDLDALANGEA